jgi:tRNA (cmo5U34)-methyltransferase
VTAGEGTDAATVWEESDSATFIERGRIYTPGRDTIARTIVNLIPAAPDAPFTGVEIGIGQGWLTDAILAAYPKARMIGLDGSPAMLDAARTLLAPHTGRFALRPFRLEDPARLDGIAGPVRCFVSCLVIHHLDGPEKRALFAACHERLEPGGALLVADIMEPTSDTARRAMARVYDAVVRDQSLAFTGGEAAFEQFRADQWNLFDYPDPDVDKPSTVPEHLAWLTDAGFTGVDVFWALAGHALVGGYKPA